MIFLKVYLFRIFLKKVSFKLLHFLFPIFHLLFCQSMLLLKPFNNVFNGFILLFHPIVIIITFIKTFFFTSNELNHILKNGFIDLFLLKYKPVFTYEVHIKRYLRFCPPRYFLSSFSFFLLALFLLFHNFVYKLGSI